MHVSAPIAKARLSFRCHQALKMIYFCIKALIVMAMFFVLYTTRDFDVADYDNSSDTAWQRTMRVNETFCQYLNLCIFGHNCEFATPMSHIFRICNKLAIQMRNKK